MEYCDSCEKKVEQIYMEGRRVMKIRGEDIPVLYKKPVCPHCSKEIYSDDVEIYISMQAKQIYRRKLRMIPTEELARYLSKKDVNVADLAKKISCSVDELIGASKGALLSKESDRTLKKIIQETA